MLIAVLIAAGTYSIISIPKESTPEVKVPVGIVSTVLPGASAEDIEKLITDKIEDEAYNVENLDTLTSISREGVSIVSVQFNANADIDRSIDDLKDAVDRAKSELPEEANDPSVVKVSFSDQPIFIASITSDLSPAELIALGKTLEDELKTIQGVSKVGVSGVRERETQVIVRAEALRTYGLRLTDVIGALAASNVSLPIGSIEVDGIDYAIKFNGSIEAPSSIGDIAIISTRGVPIYVRDVAFVSDGLEKTSTFSRVSVAGAPSEQALTVAVFKKTGGDITKLSGAVKEKLETLKGGVLSGSEVLVTLDAGEDVKKDLSELTKVGLETVALVMLSLFLTIGWRESVVAGLSIPLSFLIAFVGLLISDNTINFVSLFSLILSIGILVDSGIVVTEAIHTRYKRFGDPKAAAIASLREYAWPLIAGTMTTVAVFVPLFFLSGIVGEFIKSIPFTIIFVLLASIFVALGIVPLIAILFTKRSMNRLEAFQERWNEIAHDAYERFLRGVLEDNAFQKKFFWIIGILFVASLSLPFFGLIKVTFFPADDLDYVYVNVEKRQGTPLAETDIAMRTIEEALYDREKFPEFLSFVTTVGESSAFSPSGEGSTGNSKYGNITINMVPKDDRKRTSSDIVEVLREEFASYHFADITVFELTNGPPTGAAIAVKVRGENFDEIEQVAGSVEQLLKEIDGTVNVRSSLTNDGSELALTVDRAKASELGLNPLIIAQILRTAVNGSIATTIRNPEKDIDVIVKLNVGERGEPGDIPKGTIDALRQIPIETPRGPILLGSVVSVSLEKSSAVINHEDKKRQATVTSGLAPDMTALEVSSAFEKRRGELVVPKGIEVTFGGENDETNQTFKEMFVGLLGGMALMLAILVLVFNSFRYTAYLLAIVPLSLIGVMVGLAVSFQPISFSSLLGFIALAGVIVNHAIILLDSMVHMLERERAKPLIDIVIESSASRLRPIVLTTVTTVVGMIPLAGASSLWGPIAFTIMFGLTFSMILSLLFLPILFYRSSKVRKTYAENQVPVTPRTVLE